MNEAYSPPPTWPEFARQKATQAAQHFHAGNLAPAQRLFKEALALCPEFTDAHDSLGLCFLQSGQPDRALAQWEEGLRYDPNHLDLRQNLALGLHNQGLELLRAGQGAEALSPLERAQTLYRGLPAAHQDPQILDQIENMVSATRILMMASPATDETAPPSLSTPLSFSQTSPPTTPPASPPPAWEPTFQQTLPTASNVSSSTMLSRDELLNDQFLINALLKQPIVSTNVQLLQPWQWLFVGCGVLLLLVVCGLTTFFALDLLEPYGLTAPTPGFTDAFTPMPTTIIVIEEEGDTENNRKDEPTRLILPTAKPTSPPTPTNTPVLGETQPAMLIPTQTPRTESSLVKIDSQQGWQSTGFSVKKEGKVIVEVIEGQWTAWVGRWPYDSGQGYSYICAHAMPANRCVEPLPDFAKGALIGQIGDQVFGVGKKSSVVAQQSGTLFLRINDSDDGFYDNDGGLTVRVTVQQ